MHRTCFLAMLLLAGLFIGRPACADLPGHELPACGAPSPLFFGQPSCRRKSQSVSVLAQTSAPILSGISPTKIDAGGPNDLTLTAKGSNFSATSVVQWTMGSNTTALTTTYVSAYELQADVPAVLLATPGIAHVTVTTPGAGTSKYKSFTLLVTTLKVAGAKLSRDPSTGEITALVSLWNEGYLTAPNVAITASTLGLAATDTFLPISPGDIPAGATVTTLLTYPGFAGGTGTKTKLSLTGTFTGGSFSGSLTVKLP